RAPCVAAHVPARERGPLTIGTVHGSAASVASETSLPAAPPITVNADGSYTYDPNHAFDSLAGGASTTDSFSYTATDGTASSEKATGTAPINGPNAAPAPKPATDPTPQATAVTSTPPRPFTNHTH